MAERLVAKLAEEMAEPSAGMSASEKAEYLGLSLAGDLVGMKVVRRVEKMG